MPLSIAGFSVPAFSQLEKMFGDSALVPVRAGGVAKKDFPAFRAEIDAMAARLAALPARMPTPSPVPATPSQP